MAGEAAGRERRHAQGPAKKFGRKHGATARREESLALTARAQSVMLFWFWFGPFTSSRLA